MNTTIPTIIFSVYRIDVSANENIDAIKHAKSVFRARGIPFFTATGCYKGLVEPAFVLQDVADNLKTVRQISGWYQQECSLRIAANRQARLETPSGDLIESLGKFCETRKGLAERRDSWTECGGRYWVAA